MQVQKKKKKVMPKKETSQKVKKENSKRSKFSQDAEELLDKIDDILEENAEEFVAKYIQQGGE